MNEAHRSAERPADNEPPAPADSDRLEMTDHQRAEARDYGRRQLQCDLADKLIDVVYLALMALFFARPLDSWLHQSPLLAQYDSLRVVALVLILLTLHMVVSFPIAYYGGHVLQHRFRLSCQTIGAWLRRYLKRNALAVVFAVAMFLGLYWVIWLTGSWWWIVAAVGFFVVSVVMGQLAPVVILPLFYRIDPFDASELADRLDRLVRGTGLSIEGIYRMEMSSETVKANAMLAGLGRTRRVILSDTLIENFTPDELEVIFAHEIGHHVHRHIRKLIVAGALLSAVGFWFCDQVLQWYVQSSSGHAMPVYTVPMLMLAITLFSLLIEPLQNILSRRFERQSDRYALDRTGKTEAYQSAFQKLARLNKDDPSPHPLDVFLFHSHPSIAERLAMAETAAPVG